MTDESKKNSQLIASWANFCAVCVAIGAILIYMGRKDQELATTTAQVRELSNIVSDLAKAQVGLTVKTQQNDDRFKELAARLERLERSRQ